MSVLENVTLISVVAPLLNAARIYNITIGLLDSLSIWLQGRSIAYTS